MTTYTRNLYSAFFDDVYNGRKEFHLAINDQPFQKDDLLILNEYNPDTAMYSGRSVQATITYVMLLSGETEGSGLPDAFVILGIRRSA